MVLKYLIEMIFKDLKYHIGEKIYAYKIEKIIGQGRFGIAYLATDKYNKKVVIKQLKKSMLKKVKDKVKFEKDILTKLDDDRIPKFIGQFKYENRNGYILEYKEGKTFEEIIYKDKVAFNKYEIYDIALQLINIIKVLCENSIIHKDIRVSNVILQPGDKIALIDFGLARYINNFKYKKEEDFWYLADFLIHLYYSSYDKKTFKDKPWYLELDLLEEEIIFLKRLMGIESTYKDIYEVEVDLNKIKENINLKL